MTVNEIDRQITNLVSAYEEVWAKEETPLSRSQLKKIFQFIQKSTVHWFYANDPKDLAPYFALGQSLIRNSKADAETICAALLHQLFVPKHKKPIDMKLLNQAEALFFDKENHLPPEYKNIRELVVAALQINAIDLISPLKKLESIEDLKRELTDKEKKNLQYYRQMVCATTKDPRALRIRLTAQLEDLKKEKQFVPEPTHKKNDEAFLIKLFHAREVFAPLADLLEERELKNAFEAEYLRLVYPEAYKAISSYIAHYQRKIDEAEKNSNRITGALEKLTEKIEATVGAGDFVRVQARIKSPFSIFMKMEKKGRRLNTHITLENMEEHIHDFIGFRVVFDSEREIKNGWNVKNLTHAKYEHSRCNELYHSIKSAFPVADDVYDNYVQKPKKSGYRSLQHAFKIKKEKGAAEFEVQIMSARMFAFNHRGPASHLRYKYDLFPLADMNGDWNKARKHCFVRTPEGDFLKLPIGATTADAAAAIHMDLPARMRFAVITRFDPTDPKFEAQVSVEALLRNGDQIKIETYAPIDLEKMECLGTQNSRLEWIASLITDLPRRKRFLAKHVRKNSILHVS